MQANRQQTGAPDFFFLLLTVILLGFGFIMVFSASSMTASYNHGSIWHYVWKQLMFGGIGLVFMFIALKFPLDRLKRLYPTVLILTIIMLVLVLIIGVEVKGAKSWFGLGPFGIQPTEFAKIGLVIYIAAFIAKKGEQYRQFKKGLFRTLIVLGVIIFLIMQQPDMGSAMIIIAASVAVMIAGGANLKHFALLGLSGAFLGALYLIYEMSTNENFFGSYRVKRFTSFIDPWADPSGSGYQYIQSLFAFGHGSVTGTGFGESIQKLHYLPEAHNDFIFSIIGEEFGFLGTSIFLITYLLFIIRGIFISIRCKETFPMLLGFGLMTMVAVQALVNLFGVSGMMPITGVTLPLISYGGSSLIATMIIIGFMLNISRQPQK